ncbi:MAG: ArnT family glycosyltransferase [Candidatus Thorarchaeota archaeon]
MPSLDPPHQESKPPSIVKSFVDRVWRWILVIRFPLLIALLAILVKVAFSGSIAMWDEGWFVAIASRMADGLSDPMLPLYYPSEDGGINFFDKPPVAFWGGAILMWIFGRTTFAAKGIIALGGAGLAVTTYLLFSHQSENKSAGVIAGLLVALAHFLSFYSRTAYIDPFVVFMGALVMVLAIRTIDAVFVEKNMKKGYILIIITGIVNIFNIMTKAWQGILIGPAIVIYLVVRYIERDVQLEELSGIINETRSKMKRDGGELQDTTGDSTSHISSQKGASDSESNIDSDKNSRLDSKDDREADPYYQRKSIWLYALLGGITSFLVAGFLSNLLVASTFLALISGIACYFMVVRFESDERPGVRWKLAIASSMGGGVGGIIGGIIVKIFFDRMIDPILSIAQELGTKEVSWGPFGGIISFLSDSLTSLEGWAVILLEVLSALIGAFFVFAVTFLFSGFILDLLRRKGRFLIVFYDLLDLIPLGIIGAWFGVWFFFLLLEGEIFDRNALAITIVGTAVSLLLIPLIIAFTVLKDRAITYFNIKRSSRSPHEQGEFIKRLVFLTITIIVIMISFYPFVAWIQFLDTNIANGTFPWPIRTPGELAGDPLKPEKVTYDFLFFTYYIGWRYTHGTKYTLADSIGGAVNDYTIIIMLPFFIVGIWAFFLSEKRNPALGASLITWLLTIPLVFFPAQSQLNYYYIPLVIPYFAIGAKGIEFIYSSERWRITVTDNVEKLLAATYFYIEIGFTLLLPTLATFLDYILGFLTGMTSIYVLIESIDIIGPTLLLAGIFLIPFTFLVFRVLKTFPGIIAIGFAYRLFVLSWMKEENIKILYDVIFHDLLITLVQLDFVWIQEVLEFGAPLVTLFGIILLIFGLSWLKPNTKPQAFIFLGLVLSAMLVNISVTAHYDQILDLRFEEMAGYIKNHGGQYNHSTWVIPEGGAQFSMRYYLAVEVVDTKKTLFSSNSATRMANYYNDHTYIKFWVITNQSHWDLPIYSEEYPNAYRWLTTNPHFANVDAIVGLPTWYKMHLFVNRTWITEQGYEWTTFQG